jgi:hypothetical protein
MNVLFSEVCIEMSAEGDAAYAARLQAQLDAIEADEARIHAEHEKRIKKLEMVEKMIIARVDDLYTSLAPGQTTTAKQDTLNQQIARIRASYEPEPGAEPGSQGGRRHKRTHKRTHKRAHKRMNKQTHRR